MKVVLYKTFLCPRCLLAGHALRRLARDFPDLEIETVEITRDPLRARQDNIRTVPTLCYGNKRLTGLLLTYAELRRFLGF